MIGVLVSGEGTNLQALLDAGPPGRRRRLERRRRARTRAGRSCRSPRGRVPARAVPDRDCARRCDGGLARGARGRARGVRRLHAPPRPSFLARFPKRVVNVHPAPLPEFPARIRSRTCSRRGRRPAATVHFVDEGVDTGEVIASEPVPVLARGHRRDVARASARGRASTAPERGARAVRALISVYDKTGVADFARGLSELGFELVSSGGTAVALAEAGLAVTRVEDVTGLPGAAGRPREDAAPTRPRGNPRAGDRSDDRVALAEHGIEPFDLVCVNLYPFELAVDRPELDEAGLIEMIDVGGPALLRAAAKNFASVTVVVRARDYDAVLDELRAEAGRRRPSCGDGWPRSRSRDRRPTRHRSRAGSSVAGLPGDVRPGVRPRARAAVRREPTPAGGLLRRARRTHAPPRVRPAASGQGAVVQQPRRPLGGAAARSASSTGRPA